MPSIPQAIASRPDGDAAGRGVHAAAVAPAPPIARVGDVIIQTERLSAFSTSSGPARRTCDPDLAWLRFVPPAAYASVGTMPLVVAPGLGHTAEGFRLLGTALAAWGIPTIALNPRGKGYSQWARPIDQAHTPDFTHDLATVLDTLGLGSNVVVGGHSYGATLAYYLATGRAVRGFVSLNSVPPHLLLRGNLRLARVLWRQDRPLFRRSLRDPDALFATQDRRQRFLFGNHWTSEADALCVEQLCHESPRVAHDLLAMSLGWGWAAQRSLRTRHVGLIAGERDAFIPLDLVHASCRWFARHGKQAELRVLSGAPHDGLLLPHYAAAIAVAVCAFYRQWGIPLPPETEQMLAATEAARSGPADGAIEADLVRPPVPSLAMAPSPTLTGDETPLLQQQ